MIRPSTEIRSATVDEMPRAISALVAAFLTDPFGRFMWPSPHDYLSAAPGVAREFATAEPQHLDDVLGTFEKMAQWHPDEPHWYLPIGVEPTAQGRGLGAELMRHAVARCDDEGVLAYLESSNPRNISLYLRSGFEVMGEIQVGAAPVLTPMVRQPRRSRL